MAMEVNPENGDDLFLINTQDLECLIEERLDKNKERYSNIKLLISHFFELLNTQATTGGNHFFFLEQIEQEIIQLEEESSEMEAINYDIVSYIKETNNRAIYFSDKAKSLEMMMDVNKREKEIYISEISYLTDLSNEKDNIIDELKNEILSINMQHLNHRMNDSVNQSFININEDRPSASNNMDLETHNSIEEGNGIVGSHVKNVNNNVEVITKLLEENNAFKYLNYNLDKENSLFKKQINMLEQKHAALKIKISRIYQNEKYDYLQKKKSTFIPSIRPKNSMFLPTLNSQLSINLCCKFEKYDQSSKLNNQISNNIVEKVSKTKKGYKSKLHHRSKFRKNTKTHLQVGEKIAIKPERKDLPSHIIKLENGSTEIKGYYLQITSEQSFTLLTHSKKFSGKSYPIKTISLEIKDNTINHIYDFMNTIKKKYFTTPACSAGEVHFLYNKYFKKKKADSNAGVAIKQESTGSSSARQKLSNCNYFKSN